MILFCLAVHQCSICSLKQSRWWSCVTYNINWMWFKPTGPKQGRPSLICARNLPSSPLSCRLFCSCLQSDGLTHKWVQKLKKTQRKWRIRVVINKRRMNSRQKQGEHNKHAYRIMTMCCWALVRCLYKKITVHVNRAIEYELNGAQMKACGVTLIMWSTQGEE